MGLVETDIDSSPYSVSAKDITQPIITNTQLSCATQTDTILNLNVSKVNIC